MEGERDHAVAETFDRLVRITALVVRAPVVALYVVDEERARLVAYVGPIDVAQLVPAARVRASKPRVVVATGTSLPSEFSLFSSGGRFNWMAVLPLGAAGVQRGALVVADAAAHGDVEVLFDQLKEVRALLEDAIDLVDDAHARQLPGAKRPAPAGGRTGHDSVTGLPLRSFALAECERLIERAEILGGGFVVFMVELDRFRRINQSLGAAAGDALLRQVAERLRQAVGDSDFVARRSGDEFVVIAHDDRNNSALLAHGIRAALADPFHYQHQEVQVTATIGFAGYPAHGSDAATLLRHADIALAHAKQRGGDHAVEFDPSMESAVRDRSEIERDLRTALRDGMLSLHYQPKHTIEGRKLCGLEALVRWTHPRHGPISPVRFIPIAEETGLIVPLGAWCLGEACRQRRRWADLGFSVGPLSVNVSAVQFGRADFVGSVRRVIQETRIEPGWLELELTESVVMDDVERAVDRLSEVRKLGVRISVDDFGTGYSSLAYLSRLPVDVLKIDRSFVRDLDAEGASAKQANAIARTVSYLGKALDLEVLAEGVETEAQLTRLAEADCDAVQGYLFSKPLPVPEAERYFAKHLSSG
jgi:diguanylate cyclase (GGDEF)-like protein